MKTSAKRIPPKALSMILSLNASIIKIITNIELKSYVFSFLFFLTLPLQSQEPNIMILDAIYANDSYLFHHGHDQTVCKPYGVWTIERALRRSDIGSVCKKTLDDFLLHNPKLRYFSSYKMHVEQGYRIAFRNSECIIYLGSKQTLSEALLQAGVAIEQPGFSDEEFRYRFYQALRAAKVNKRGIWSDAKLQSCMSEFFKE